MGRGRGGGGLTLRVAITPTGDISVMPQECRTSTPMLQAPHPINEHKP